MKTTRTGTTAEVSESTRLKSDEAKYKIGKRGKENHGSKIMLLTHLLRIIGKECKI